MVTLQQSSNQEFSKANAFLPKQEIQRTFYSSPFTNAPNTPALNTARAPTSSHHQIPQVAIIERQNNRITQP